MLSCCAAASVRPSGEKASQLTRADDPLSGGSSICLDCCTWASEAFRCPADKGMEESFSGPWKPSKYAALGCSYRLNASLLGNWTLQTPADPDYNLAGKKESWVLEPARFILMHESPAFVYADNGNKFFFHWHYVRGATTLTVSQLKQDSQKFISPILFVDGQSTPTDSCAFSGRRGTC